MPEHSGIFSVRKMSNTLSGFRFPFAGFFLSILCFAFFFAAETKTRADFVAELVKPTPTPKKKAAPAKAKRTPERTSSSQKKSSTSSTKQTPKSKTTAKSSSSSSKKQSSTAKSSNAKKSEKKTDSKPAKAVSSAKSKSTEKSKSSAAAKKTSKAKTSAAKTPVKSAAPKTGNATATAARTQFIVTEVSSRVRANANSGSKEICRLPFGTVFSPSSRLSGWLKVSCSPVSGAATGWIRSGIAREISKTDKFEVYEQVIDKKFSDRMDFATASEMAFFLRRIIPEVESDQSAGLISFRELLALRTALQAIPREKIKQPMRDDFVKAFDDQVVYNEPAGLYLVRSNLFWNLHQKYIDTPLADSIAWEAARNPLPGECEGYVNCHLFYVRMTSGEYLSLHPRGTKSADALRDVTNFLEPIAADLSEKAVYNGPTDVTDRAEFYNLIAELRTIISRLPNSEKEKPLNQLKQIAEAFR
jgi:hypothetical protein